MCLLPVSCNKKITKHSIINYNNEADYENSKGRKTPVLAHGQTPITSLVP